MSTADTHATEVHEHAHPEHAHADHPSDMLYIKVAAVLAVITGLETYTYFQDFGQALVPVLLVCMTVKFYLIARYFMHLKFDNRVLQRFFIVGVILALAVYMIALLSFKFFSAAAPS